MYPKWRTDRSTECQNFARNPQTFVHFILQDSIPMMVVRIRERFVKVCKQDFVFGQNSSLDKDKDKVFQNSSLGEWV